IPAIVAICSWQDAHDYITTPLRKRTGNNGEVNCHLPATIYGCLKARTGIRSDCYRSTDFAVVDVHEMSAKLLLKKMWQVAKALGARYAPVGIERNGKRVSDALPPLAFAEMTGLLAADHPLAAFKIEGIAADPSAIVELLMKEKLMLNPKDGQKGIVPLAL